MVILSFDPAAIQNGDRHHVVVAPVAVDPQNLQHLVRDCVSGYFYRVDGCLGESAASYALLSVKVVVNGRVPQLSIDSQSFVIPHSIPDWPHMHDLVEACSGMGFMGVGTTAVGLCPIAGCDINKTFCDAYTKIQGRVAIHGDIGNPSTVADLWAKCANLSGIIAGVSCQPYSVLGDHGSGSDARAASLPGVLHAIHWLRAPYAILECVPPIANDPYAQKELDDFCKGTGYTRHEVILSLSDIWPSRRQRWWCILSAPALGKIVVPPFPSNFGLSKIAQLITGDMQMDQQELDQLLLSEVECAAFGTDSPSCEYFMNGLGVLPCALHAWGNQLSACPCGCRQQGLSERRLKERGLHGVLAMTSDDKPRHLHPAELAVLCGADPVEDWEPLKFSLCGIGQLASPLQSLWVGAHVKVHLERIQFGEAHTSPFRELAAYASWLIARSHMIWKPAKLGGELAPLVEAWSPLRTLTMDQLMSLEFWVVKGHHVTLATILEQIMQVDPDSSLGRFIQREKETLCDIPDAASEVIPATVPFEIEEERPPKKLRVTTDSDEVGYEVQISGDATIEKLTDADREVRLLTGTCRAFFQGCVLSPGDMAAAYDEVHIDECAPVVDSSDDGESGPLPCLMPEETHCPDESGAIHVVVEASSEAPCPDGDGSVRSAVDPGLMPADPLPTEVVPDVALEDSHVASSVDQHRVPAGESGPLPFLMSGGDREGSAMVAVSHLASLQPDALLQVSGPLMTSDLQITGLLAQAIQVQERTQVLAQQELLWADDEIRWHLVRLQQQFHEGVANDHRFVSRQFNRLAVVDPLLAHGWIKCGVRDVASWCSSHCQSGVDCIVMIAPVNQHWVPFVMWVDQGKFRVHTWDVQEADHTPVWPVLCALGQALGISESPEVFRDHRMFIHHCSCGALAVSFVVHKLFMHRLPMVKADAEFVHQTYREIFVRAIAQYQTCCRPWVWAAGPHVHAENQLRQLLEEKGVSKDDSTKRVADAMKAIGAKGISQSFSFKDPWRQLKTLGNQVKFQFILPHELQKFQEQHGKRPPKKASKAPEPKRQFTLDPKKLQVPPGTFACNGAALNQLELHQIGPIAEGFVLTTVLEVEAYLRANQAVSKCPLAFVIISGLPSDFPTSLPQANVTLPCRCSIDREPILVDVTVVQVGHGFVEKSVEKSLVSVATMEVATLKLMVYKDELEDWGLITNAPMRYVVSQFPMLTLCEEASCSCPRWHNPKGLATKTAVLDVWRRQYLRTGFKQEVPASACIFSVCIRVPLELLQPLLEQSGRGGIYCEPRSDDGRAVVSEYAIVWSPKVSKAELLRQKQTTPEVVGLARIGDRMGLRVKTVDAPTIHARLRPDSLYLAGGQRLQFVVGPMPFGSDRASICKALQAFDWETKPLQPISSQPNKGAMWLVHAVSEPSQNLLKMGHGDVMITRHRMGDKEAPPAPPQPVAAPATLALCGQVPGKDKGQDPWQGWQSPDPWQKPMAVDIAPPSETLKRIESQIEQAVLSRLPDASRLQTLEDQVTTIMSKHAALENQVREADHRQQVQIAEVRNEVSQQGHQLRGALEGQKQDISAMFQSQMQQIRGLLKKRDRNESDDDNMEFDHHRRPRCAASARPFWVIRWCLFCVLVRVGEAAHPGPAGSDDCKAAQFTLGCFNPSGLNGKAHQVSHMMSYGDLWCVSETHLTTRSLHSFRAGLKASKSEFKYMVAGYPVPARSDKTHSGLWRGVATLCKHPTRSLPHCWAKDLHVTSRINVSASLIGDLWVTVGSFYGIPDSSAYPQSAEHNNVLLNALVDQVAFLSHGCRMIAGDFNVFHDQLEAQHRLTQAGFRELQSIAFDRWGLEPQPTCKGRTRRDFVYISMELQALLTGVQVNHEAWPDHSPVSGTFVGHSRSIPKYLWPVPTPLQWPQPFEPEVSFPTGCSPTEAYPQVWSQLEAAAYTQKPSLQPSAFGRGHRWTPKKVLGTHSAPIRNARLGEVVPNCLCPSLQHSRWFKQLRRLQSLVNGVKAAALKPDDAHRQLANVELWTSIRRGKGFSPDFATWYEQSEHKVVGAPQCLGQALPDPAMACALFQSFNLAVRHLETQLQKCRREYASIRRTENPHRIFQDLRAPSVGGVDLLIKPLHGQVETVDADASQAVLTKPVDFDPQLPVYCRGQQVPVIHSELDSLWFEAFDLRPGDVLTQQKMTGHIEQLFEEFESSWAQRWKRHQHVPVSQWDSIIGFARQHIATQNIPHVALTGSQLAEIVARKPKKSSCGLDGVRVEDLQAQAPSNLQHFCRFFDHAERTGKWPRQLVTGRVVSLAKVSAPVDAMSFRPITVLSLLYRLWGSWHTKQTMKVLNASLPSDLYGSRPARHATQVWTQLAWLIEEAFTRGDNVGGFFADLQKAFNHLPRTVVVEVAALFGVPCPILLGWTGAVTSLVRHFDLRGQLSPGLNSYTGYPEGCSLSCLSMILIDSIFHFWIDSLMGPLRTLTYVDDWQVISTDSSWLDRAWTAALRFAEQVDIIIDPNKTCTWSLDPGTRKALRNGGYRVVHCTRHLGAHIQLGRRHTNKELVSRTYDLQRLWDALRLSPSPYVLKVRALKTAAWPRGLHGVPAVSISNALITSLRAGAMRGLSADAAGASSVLHLGCVEHPLADPGFWTLMQTLRTVRDCGTPQHVRMMLTEIAHGWSDAPKNTISHVLLERLQQVAWSVDLRGQLSDSIGTFDLFSISFQELQFRAELAWVQVVAHSVAHRQGFDQFSKVDAADTRRWVSLLSRQDAGMFRTLLNGSFFTADFASHWNPEADVCQYCECEDSRYHRFWQCDAFDSLRSDLDEDVWARIPDLPEALTCYGWSLVPDTNQWWLQYLGSIPDYDLGSGVLLSGQVVRVFTDGSCFHQHDSLIRHAGWAVVARLGGQPIVLAKGVLPGLIQTSFRAELYAVVICVELATVSQTSVQVVCDNEAVVKGFRRLRQGGMVRPNMPNADLWRRLQAVLDPQRHDIEHIRSHQPHGDDSTCDAWLNDYADRTAIRANLDRSAEVWRLHAAHVEAVQQTRNMCRQVQRVLLRISQAVLTGDRLGDEVVDQPPSPEPVCDDDSPFEPWCWQGLLPPGLLQYGARYVQVVQTWLTHVFQGEMLCTDGVCPQWISSYQLYLDFQLSMGHCGPRFLDGRWEMFSPLSAIAPISFKVRCRWWTRVLATILREFGSTLVRAYTKPVSDMLFLHTGCFRVVWPQWRLQVIDEWFGSHLRLPATRAGGALLNLPCATLDRRMAPA
eukprot:Skav227392  [mRNA]  locus=scaffold3215:106803:116693:+ [translate_table: standard]